MLDNTLNFVTGGATIVLTRANQDNFSSTYIGENAAGTERYTATFSTTQPRGDSNESHMCRIDREVFDANGVYLRKESSWLVSKTFDAHQVTASLQDLAGDWATALRDSRNLNDRVIGRES